MDESSEHTERTDKVEALASITVSKLMFSDGSAVELSPNDIVVFVGPNNAGKSASLREIEAHLGRNPGPSHVISNIDINTVGTPESVKAALERHSYKHHVNGQLHYSGSGYNVPASSIQPGWSSRLDIFRPFFCRRLRTETRIIDSNPANSYSVLEEAASKPVQMLYADSEVELRLSGYFRQAFNQDLIVMKGGGSQIPLLVGKRLPLRAGEDPTMRSYLQRLVEHATPLKEQGDGMRSFASVILEMLTTRAPSILLLDEPEAFLHPPQARLLGEFLARERGSGAQMFIATHSPDVLLGLLTEAPDQLRVIRIQREGNKNYVKELEKAKALEIASDPLMKYSSVLSGVFHQRAIICEADSDCLFYNAMLSQPSVNTGPNADVLFLHASGKHRMSTMAAALRALGVPVDVIADIDLLSEKGPFQKLVEVMGGDWSQIEPDWLAVKTSIESRKPWLNADGVKYEINASLSKLSGESEFPRALTAEIRSTLKKSTPWEALKQAGDAAIPSGQPTQHMKQMRANLEPLGIWIVPEGELEGFCRSIGSHGPKWVQSVLEARDLDCDPELESARALVRSIWSRAIQLADGAS